MASNYLAAGLDRRWLGAIGDGCGAAQAGKGGEFERPRKAAPQPKCGAWRGRVLSCERAATAERWTGRLARVGAGAGGMRTWVGSLFLAVRGAPSVITRLERWERAPPRRKHAHPLRGRGRSEREWQSQHQAASAERTDGGSYVAPGLGVEVGGERRAYHQHPSPSYQPRRRLVPLDWRGPSDGDGRSGVMPRAEAELLCIDAEVDRVGACVVSERDLAQHRLAPYRLHH
eukprot:scaffold4173_cov29-Tisochrysis_lutea.AAC.4